MQRTSMGLSLITKYFPLYSDFNPVLQEFPLSEHPLFAGKKHLEVGKKREDWIPSTAPFQLKKWSPFQRTHSTFQ